MTRRVSALGLIGCVAALIAAPGASAATTNNCQLAAVVDFGGTPLGTALNPGPFGFTLTGSMADCKSDPATTGQPASATITIGGVYTAPNGHGFRLPAGTGTGSCANTTETQWSGTALVRWAGGGVTIVPLTMKTFGPFGAIVADVALSNMQLEPLDPEDDPLTITTTQYSGYSSIGATSLQFDAAQCQAGGVKSASLSGSYGPYKF